MANAIKRKEAAATWCYHLGGLDPHRIANMTLAEFGDLCVLQIGMIDPPSIPGEVVAGLRFYGQERSP